MIKVKVRGASNGKKYELYIPAIIDSDGEITLEFLQVIGAGQCMRGEMYPESLTSEGEKIMSKRK